MKMTPHHLCHILLVRSQSQFLPYLKGSNDAGTLIPGMERVDATIWTIITILNDEGDYSLRRHKLESVIPPESAGEQYVTKEREVKTSPLE